MHTAQSPYGGLRLATILSTAANLGDQWVMEAVCVKEVTLNLSSVSTPLINTSSFWLHIWGTAPANHVMISAGDWFEVVKPQDHLSIFDVGVIP